MANIEKKEKSAPAEVEEVLKFSKKALAESNTYRDRKDLVNALLEDDKEYTHKETDDIIKNFLEREV